MSVKQDVRNILIKYPASRTDDKLLLLSVYKEKGLEKLLGRRFFNDFVEFFMDAPCMETIRRSRQKIIQEEKS